MRWFMGRYDMVINLYHCITIIVKRKERKIDEKVEEEARGIFSRNFEFFLIFFFRIFIRIYYKKIEPIRPKTFDETLQPTYSILVKWFCKNCEEKLYSFSLFKKTIAKRSDNLLPRSYLPLDKFNFHIISKLSSIPIWDYVGENEGKISFSLYIAVYNVTRIPRREFH